jgi:hypothetical protein
MISPNSGPTENWRDYQRRLQSISRRKYLRSRLPLLGLYGVLLFGLIAAVVLSGPWIFAHLNLKPAPPGQEPVARDEGPERLLRQDLPGLFGPLRPGGLGDVTAFTVDGGGRTLRVETTLDAGLQSYIEGLLGRSLTHRAAVVALDPADGRILAMASYSGEEGGRAENLCLKGSYPAASLFKVVAAAAAIEARGFTPDKELTYQGRRYTLYKKQLKQVKKGRYTNVISFQKAFSSSINPVFGKIGIYHLGQAVLEQYAAKFLFNAAIPLELPLEPSRIDVPSDDFGLAEIASGFNKRTLISPVHACLMAATVANDGVMMTPWMIRRIHDAGGRKIYLADIEPLANPVTADTARRLRVLMQDTIEHGTCRRTFRTLRKKQAFQEVDIGAKTGTINDPQDRYKFDWLSAYVLPRDGRRPLCLTVLAVHGKKLGIRAKNLARYILEHRYG